MVRDRRLGLLVSVTLAVLAFSLFRKLDVFLQIGNRLADSGWSLIPILFTIVLVQMAASGVAVLVVLPPLLGFSGRRQLLRDYFRVERRIVLLGAASFILFGILATAIALMMGIFRGDWSVILARPDLTPDPDVIGWGYFIIALVPGIWEELAFRGLIQSRLQQRFSTRTAILLSATFFGLFHITNLLTQAPSTVAGGVIMAFCFGLGWGLMTARTGSVVPAMISHYLVDAIGQVFLNVDSADPAQATLFFLLLTIAFSVFMIALTEIAWPRREEPRAALA